MTVLFTRVSAMIVRRLERKLLICKSNKLDKRSIPVPIFKFLDLNFFSNRFSFYHFLPISQFNFLNFYFIFGIYIFKNISILFHFINIHKKAYFMT